MTWIRASLARGPLVLLVGLLAVSTGMEMPSRSPIGVMHVLSRSAAARPVAWDESVPGPSAGVREERPRTSGSEPRPAVLVRVPHNLPITARPGGGRVIGRMPSSSEYYHRPIVAWVIERSSKGRYGRVPIPYSASRATGWIRLKGLTRTSTPISVRADLSRHLITVNKLGKVLFRTKAATGRPASPTPPGFYFVTDRVDTRPWPTFGSFAFGLSGIQPHTPPGWGGGNQLAIHGTNDPGSIGESASAGCLRVSESALAKLKALLRLGTPVIIQR